MDVNEIAKICHEVNRGLCEGLGDYSQRLWEDAPDWQVQSAINGVHNVANGGEKPSQSHEGWLDQKEHDGWVYGEKKDPEAKTHPCMVPFDELPAEQRLKDHLFVTVAKVLLEG